MAKKNRHRQVAENRRAAKRERRARRKDTRENRAHRDPTEIRRALRIFELPNPAEGLPHEVLAGALASRGSEFAAMLPTLIDRIHELVVAAPPDLLLATLSIKNLLIGSQNPNNLHDSTAFSCLELLQAIALTYEPDDYVNFNSLIALDGPRLSELEQLIEKAQDAFSMMRMKDIVNPDGSPRLSPEMPALEFMRLHTQRVRVPGYPFQIENALGAVLANLGSALPDALGVTSTEVVLFLRSLRLLLADRLHKHRTAMQRVLKESSLAGLVSRYHTEFSDLADNSSELIELFSKMPNPVNAAKWQLCAHSAFRMALLLEVSGAELSTYAGSGLSEESAQVLLEVWSLAFGKLKGKNTEYFFLDNPVWRRPFVRCTPHRYLIVNPLAHHAFPWLMAESLTTSVPSLKKRYPDARSDFLESQMSRALEAGFPSGHHLRNAKWKHPISGDEFETDHVCLVGSILVVAEAKSGKVQGATLRGAPASLRDNVNSMMIYPSVQSKRLCDAISSSSIGVELRSEDGRTLMLTRESAHIVVRINCTLEGLGLLMTRWRDLRDAGIIDEEHEIAMAPTLPLFDLDVVSRVLRSEGALAHYLFRRDYIERALNYTGDELDLLAFYLDTAFSIADRRAIEGRFDISTLSRRFDREFLTDEEPSSDAAMPTPRMTKFWRDLIACVESHNSDARIIGSIMLRDVAPECQAELEKKIKTAKANVRKYRSARNNVVEIVTGHDIDRAIILFLAHDDSIDLPRRESAEAAANNAAKRYGAKRVLVFWYHADRDEYPYGGMGLYCYNAERTISGRLNTANQGGNA